MSTSLSSLLNYPTGPTGPQGTQGAAGPTGPGNAGVIPAGGIAGQILAKASNADYDMIWVDPPNSTLSLDGGGVTGPVTSTVSGGSPTATVTSIVDGGNP